MSLTSGYNNVRAIILAFRAFVKALATQPINSIVKWEYYRVTQDKSDSLKNVYTYYAKDLTTRLGEVTVTYADQNKTDWVDVSITFNKIDEA